MFLLGNFYRQNPLNELCFTSSERLRYTTGDAIIIKCWLPNILAFFTKQKRDENLSHLFSPNLFSISKKT